MGVRNPNSTDYIHPDESNLLNLHKALFLDSSPAPTKFAIAHLGLCEPDVRLPIAPCNEAVKPAILEAMREAGLV